ncbi:Para-aminobenzoate synthase, aminase component [hydrothermal vent metagenome]|uniref:Para-aminobenzoate synthase, aminase component n=1 Tax=hydrothermal vent metagenome TaxID=652676 RepID=A0A3B1A1E4_9ZZZZ
MDNLKLESQYKVIEPVVDYIDNVNIDPLTIYEKITSKNTFLLHSSRNSDPDGRYSYIGYNAKHVIKVYQNTVLLDDKVSKFSPLEIIDKYSTNIKVKYNKKLPPFCGGLVGYYGYESNHYFETLPRHPKDDSEIPDIYFLVIENVICFDHFDNKIILISVDENFSDACLAINKMKKIIAYKNDNTKIYNSNSDAYQNVKFRSNYSKDEYINSIKKIKEYINNGDTFQVNLSQRLEVDTKENPLDIYRKLININPVNFSSYLSLDGFQIASGSPERLVRVTNSIVDTRPIAGTRKRGTKEKESVYIKELMNSEKEIAEHSMLVDLERNDIGKVCEYGSVSVTKLMEIVKYSHVMHIESHIQGKLKKQIKPSEIVGAMFPGGTITGVPKIRTMEIITELEPNVRGIYTGSIGYYSYSGNTDFNIAIRTILIKNQKAYIQVGGGIVQDANPDMEYNETLHKARAQLSALAIS